MKTKYILSLLTIGMIAAIIVEIFYFHIFNYIFRTIFLFTSFSVIIELHARAHKLSNTGKIARFCVFGLLFSLVIVPTIPLTLKSDYLEIKEVSYEITNLSSGADQCKIKVKWHTQEGIREKFGTTAVIRIAITDYYGTLDPPVDTRFGIITYKDFMAKDCEGNLKEYWFLDWHIKNIQGTFKAKIYIKPSINVDASPYTVEMSCQLEPISTPSTPGIPGDITGGEGNVWFTQVKIEVYAEGTEGGEEVVDFGIKVTAYNSYSKDLTDAFFELKDKPSEVRYSGKEINDLTKIVSKQSRTATFKTFTVAQDEDEITIVIEVEGKIKDVGKVTDKEEIKIDPSDLKIPVPDSPGQNDNTDDPNIFGELFSAVISDPAMQPIFIMMIFGFIIVLIGAGMDSKSLMGLGAFVTCFPAGLSVFTVMLGWTAPSAYFVELAGESLASLAQGMVTLFTCAIIVSVSYTFAGLVGSVRE